jgi:hypothetical protein
MNAKDQEGYNGCRIVEKGKTHSSRLDPVCKGLHQSHQV